MLASGIATAAPGAASAASATASAGDQSGSELLDVTMEHILKLSKDEVAALTVSMGAEWKAILSDAEWKDDSQGRLSSQEPGYWLVERAKKMRRMRSEPQSPVASAAARVALQE